MLYYERIDVSEGIGINKVYQGSVIFVTIGIFLSKVFQFSNIYMQ